MSSYSVYVKNNSSSNLKLLIYDRTTLDFPKKAYDSVFVDQGTAELLKSSTERTSVQLCTNNKDSIVAIVRDNSSLRVAKDLNSENSYQSNKSGNSIKGHTIKCETVIANADIVPK